VGENKVHIDSTPEHVFEQLTKDWEAADPSPLKVGDQFRPPGKSEVFTVTLMESPNRFGFSVLVGDNTTSAEYTILPDGTGSLVRVEMDSRSPSTPGIALMVGGIMEGRAERKLLNDLKAAAESGKSA
jgi:hypothetical protein